MPFAFPVSLDVTGRRCVVVGAGSLATAKADALNAAGADVVRLPADGYEPAVLDGAFLVVATGEDDTDRAALFADAEQRGVLVNSLDDVDNCHFAFPAVVDRGDLKVTISTAGRAPALAGRLRRQLDELLPEALAALVDVLGDTRETALPRRVPFAEWAAQWRAALEDLDGLVDLVERGHADQVRDRVLAALRREAS